MKYIYTLLSLFITVNIATAQWVQKSGLPGDRRHHPVNFVLNNTAYLLTGVNSNNQLLQDFYSYDYPSDTWTQKTDFPGTARGFAYGVNFGGKGYIGFGISNTAYLNDLWQYDPVTDGWTLLALCPGPGRRHPAMVALDNKVFVGCGDGATGDLNDFWIYDIATDSWTQGPNLPGDARHHPYYFGIGDYVYVGFGHSGQTIYKDFYRYNVKTNSWEQLTDFPGESRVAGTQQAYNGKGYIISGDGSDHRNLDTGEFYEYDPASDSWTQLTAHPGQGRWALGSFVIGNRVFITAGETGSGTLWNDLWTYELEPAVGIEENIANNESFNIYPNPANSFITLPSELIDGENIVNIFTSSGEQVYSNVAFDQNIDISEFSPQLYLMMVHTPDGDVFTSKFLKQ